MRSRFILALFCQTMNKFLRGFINLLTAYLKIEIIGGLILVILVVGYVLFTNNRRDVSPSVPDTVPTLQE